jgi:protein SCO1/2
VSLAPHGSVPSSARPGARVRGAILALCALLATGLALGGCAAGGGQSTPSPTASSAGGFAPYVYEPAEQAPALDLTDQDGAPFSLSHLEGKVVLISFGYTHCPDVCPTTLAIARNVEEARPDQTAVVFVTIDPARDTADALRDYLAYYVAPMIGLTGSDARIAATASEWGVFYQKGEVAPNGSYAMAHTAGTFVVDPEGRLRYRFTSGTPVDVLVAAIDDLTG